jgi:hypothetical protein
MYCKSHSIVRKTWQFSNEVYGLWTFHYFPSFYLLSGGPSFLSLCSFSLFNLILFIPPPLPPTIWPLQTEGGRVNYVRRAKKHTWQKGRFSKQRAERWEIMQHSITMLKNTSSFSLSKHIHRFWHLAKQAWSSQGSIPDLLPTSSRHAAFSPLTHCRQLHFFKYNNMTIQTGPYTAPCVKKDIAPQWTESSTQFWHEGYSNLVPAQWPSQTQAHTGRGIGGRLPVHFNPPNHPPPAFRSSAWKAGKEVWTFWPPPPRPTPALIWIKIA